MPPGFPDAIADLPAHAEFGGAIFRDGPGNFWTWILTPREFLDVTAR